jgi:hypothetical protein
MIFPRLLSVIPETFELRPPCSASDELFRNPVAPLSKVKNSVANSESAVVFWFMKPSISAVYGGRFRVGFAALIFAQ